MPNIHMLTMGPLLTHSKNKTTPPPHYAYYYIIYQHHNTGGAELIDSVEFPYHHLHKLCKDKSMILLLT
jgi:hypothetical protein